MTYRWEILSLFPRGQPGTIRELVGTMVLNLAISWAVYLFWEATTHISNILPSTDSNFFTPASLVEPASISPPIAF